MNLLIDNYAINAPIKDILTQVNIETGGLYLKQIRNHNSSVMITCPWHKDGQESHPSCSVYAEKDNPDIYYGTCHCFTCGKVAPLSLLVSKCFEKDVAYGKQWLIDNFGEEQSEVNIWNNTEWITPITSTYTEHIYMDESILNNFNFYHPYMSTRHLTPEILQKFKIGYDKDTDSLTFPVWDEFNNLLFISRRSVTGKTFQLASGIDKPIYLLNYALQEQLSTVIVCEGQIDALIAYSYGVPAVALFGAGTTQNQMELLNKSDITNFILMYDNDEAGRTGAKKFKQLINKNKIVIDILMPKDKDLADLTQSEFNNLLITNGLGNLIFKNK